jgi:hypothetical protein
MKKSKLIFHILFVLFHVALFIIAVYVYTQRDNFSFLLKVQTYITYMPYMAFVGLVLLGLNYLFIMIKNRTFSKEMESVKKENNLLKAKMFDLQEAQKETRQAPSSPDTDK